MGLAPQAGFIVRARQHADQGDVAAHADGTQRLGQRAGAPHLNDVVHAHAAGKVAHLLHGIDYSLQSNRKTEEGRPLCQDE